MVVYVKDHRGNIKSLDELAREYNLPYKLLRGRWSRGKRTFEELTLPKYDYRLYKNNTWKKGEN